MKVKELIETLKNMNQELEVECSVDNGTDDSPFLRCFGEDLFEIVETDAVVALIFIKGECNKDFSN